MGVTHAGWGEPRVWSFRELLVLEATVFLSPPTKGSGPGPVLSASPAGDSGGGGVAARPFPWGREGAGSSEPLREPGWCSGALGTGSSRRSALLSLGSSWSYQTLPVTSGAQQSVPQLSLLEVPSCPEWGRFGPRGLRVAPSASSSCRPPGADAWKGSVLTRAGAGQMLMLAHFHGDNLIVSPH